MKKMLSPAEFSVFLQERSPVRAEYRSEDQPGWDALRESRLRLFFDDVRVLPATDAVLMRGGSCEVMIPGIAGAEVDEETLLSTVILRLFLPENRGTVVLLAR